MRWKLAAQLKRFFECCTLNLPTDPPATDSHVTNLTALRLHSYQRQLQIRQNSSTTDQTSAGLRMMHGMELPNMMASGSPHEFPLTHSARSSMGSESPVRPAAPKNVAFELLFPESPQYKARLPLRVQIFPHDSTESIVTTVKNFYGLYSGPTGSKGISFEDDRGFTLIAGYENFRNNMVVYVRVIEDSPTPGGTFLTNTFPPATIGAQSFGHSEFSTQPAQHFGQHMSRPASRMSRKRSLSPNADRGRRSDSVGTNPTAGKKVRSRSSKRSNFENHSDSLNGYSSGDNGSPSVSSKAKEPIGNTDISLENIVEGGRRKRAKFESSVSLLITTPNPAQYVAFQALSNMP